MGNTPAQPTLILFLIFTGVAIWFCFARMPHQKLKDELKYLAGFCAIGFVSIYIACIYEFEVSYEPVEGVDVNFEGVWRKFWTRTMRPYFLCFLFLSGIRLLIFALRQRFTARKSAES